MAPYNPPDAHYAHINLEMKPDELKKLIGRNGKTIYYWTKKSGLDYIWVDFDKSRIELWGKYYLFKKKNVVEQISVFIEEQKNYLKFRDLLLENDM